MFLKNRKKRVQVYAPCDGTIVNLDNVPDPAFSERMVGEGVAILPSSGEIYSPIDGTVEHMFETHHAFSISSDSVEVLVHVGIESLTLKGEGFKKVKSEIDEGFKLERSDKILEVDLEGIREKIPSVITPIVITNYDEIDNFTCLKTEGTPVRSGEPIFEFTVK